LITPIAKVKKLPLSIMNILNYDDAFTPVDKGPYKEGSWGFIVIIAA
jgi:hypothetical protein